MTNETKQPQSKSNGHKMAASFIFHNEEVYKWFAAMLEENGQKGLTVTGYRLSKESTIIEAVK